jgi:hypothetical protein
MQKLTRRQLIGGVDPGRVPPRGSRAWEPSTLEVLPEIVADVKGRISLESHCFETKQSSGSDPHLGLVCSSEACRNNPVSD